MNPPPPGPGFMPSGGMPIWHPPISSTWIATIVIVFMGAVANRIPHAIRGLMIQPVGFFLIALAAMGSYWMQFLPGTLAILFFLLAVWSAEAGSPEGFLNASNTIDWVTNSKKWFVEKILKERPLGIQEKDVSTFPVQD